MTTNESDEIRAAREVRVEREVRIAVTLTTVFFLLAALLWILEANTIGSYVRAGSTGGPIDFSGWSVTGFAFAIFFTVLLAVGFWVVVALSMYERVTKLPYRSVVVDKATPAPPPRIDYRH